MNLLQAIFTAHACVLFAEFYLIVNQNNPARHIILAFYGYMFYLYLTMEEHSLIADMEPGNYTCGKII
jgi:hypothetical protein